MTGYKGPAHFEKLKKTIDETRARINQELRESNSNKTKINESRRKQPLNMKRNARLESWIYRQRL